MIFEARCNDCDKRIGYISILGDVSGLEETKCIKQISYRAARIVLLCDKCREGRFDLNEVKKECL